MSNYAVQLNNRADKHLRGLPKRVRRAVSEALLEMEFDPFGGDHKKLKAGEGHRRRVGKYRILYDVDTDLQLVSVSGIFHRRDAYRG